jgi:hypothetical protein
VEGWLIFFGVIGGIWLIVWINGRLSNLQQKAKKYDEAKTQLDRIKDLEKREEKFNREMERREEKFNKEIERKEVEFKEESDANEYVLWEQKVALEKLVKEKTEGFPWLVAAYNDYFELQDKKNTDYLRHKSHPARKTADEIRQIAKERREAEKAARLGSYLIDYCKYLAPWLDEYIGLEANELDEIIKEIHTAWEKKEEEFDEEVKRHVGPKYEGLSPTQKIQRKLDWYWEKPNKTDWQIGREYERYIGYLYEIKGWRVYYHGKKGFEDLGRDLICNKGDLTEIIQCKRWAQEKTIHEKHIYYLFGTTVEYYLNNIQNKENLELSSFPEIIRKKNVIPKLVSTTKVSDIAAQVAKILGVVIEEVSFPNTVPPYPSVKCNVARRTGEKIYHLPFDQQYDTALIEEERLECYVEKIAEAENKGFRHAYHWKGEIIQSE